MGSSVESRAEAFKRISTSAYSCLPSAKTAGVVTAGVSALGVAILGAKNLFNRASVCEDKAIEDFKTVLFDLASLDSEASEEEQAEAVAEAELTFRNESRKVTLLRVAGCALPVVTSLAAIAVGNTMIG